MFVEPTFSEISGDEQQDARSPVGRRREPPLVWQGEMLYRHRRDSSMVEEGNMGHLQTLMKPKILSFCHFFCFRRWD